MEFVDSHCHLDDLQFKEDRQQVIERALGAGVTTMLAIGTGDGPPDLEAAVRVADAYSLVYATVGVHPNDAQKVDAQTFFHLECLLAHPKVRALGELGLDYHWGVPKEAQMPVFRQQLEMASQARLPIVIHTRDAWDDTLAVLREHWAPTGLPCVMHCFTGSPKQARECFELGFTLAFGGVATFPKGSDIRAAAQSTPPDRILLETDAPYLAPVPYRGKRNEPAYLVKTADVIAQALGISTEELATLTTANYQRVFGIQTRTLH